MTPHFDSTTPIFVRGVSRSGGTLMVTLLDAHPDIAMSYELYPSLLDRDGVEIDLDWLACHLARSKSLTAAGKSIDLTGLRTFVLRCGRGGLGHRELSELVASHHADGFTFSDETGRFRFMERCCLAKMEREGKRFWGLKCSSDFETYLEYWPAAYFINIVRDGRDVLASQLNTGSFEPDPAQVGRSWSTTNRKFRRLVGRNEVRAHEVIYERLAHDPEGEVARLTAFLGLSFEPTMLRYYDQDLTIYSTNHLSMERISKPIDTTRIGRWQEELNPQQIHEFYRTAGDMMAELGYITPREADP